MGVAGGGLHTLVGCLAASMVVGVRLSGVEDSCLDRSHLSCAQCRLSWPTCCPGGRVTVHSSGSKMADL